MTVWKHEVLIPPQAPVTIEHWFTCDAATPQAGTAMPTQPVVPLQNLMSSVQFPEALQALTCVVSLVSCWSQSKSKVSPVQPPVRPVVKKLVWLGHARESVSQQSDPGLELASTQPPSLGGEQKLAALVVSPKVS